MMEKLAKIISIIFHPVLVPSLGFVLLLNSGFYFSALNFEAKRFLLLVVVFTTAVLPLLSVAIMALNPKFDITMQEARDRVVPLLSSSFFYYLGFYLINKVRLFPVFKLFFIASVLVLVILMFISFKWKISTHMAAIGGLTATVFALAFRSGINPQLSVLCVILVSGLVGTARLVLKKHNLPQLAAGYLVGFILLYAVIYFV